MQNKSIRVAIIGAGIAGLSCARELTKQAFEITLFDKSKRPGGRTSSRLFEQWSVDHGAQYFTAKSALFKDTVQGWQKDGLVGLWDGEIIALNQSISSVDNIGSRFVSIPIMGSLAASLAEGLSIHTESTINKIERVDSSWRLFSKEHRELPGFYDVVIIAIPPKQAKALLINTTPRLQNLCSSVNMLPCWTLIAYYDEKVRVSFDGAFLEHSVFSWIARNNSKPGRPPGEAWVAQANPEWSMQNIDKSNFEVEPILVSELEKLLNKSCQLYQSHLWRYARVESPMAHDFEFDKRLQLGLCGDWFINSTVEGAWTSGYLLANEIIKSYKKGLM